MMSCSSAHSFFCILADFFPCAPVETFPSRELSLYSRCHEVAGTAAHDLDGLAGRCDNVCLFFGLELVGSLFSSVLGSSRGILCHKSLGRRSVSGGDGWETDSCDHGRPQIVYKGQEAIFVLCEDREDLYEYREQGAAKVRGRRGKMGGYRFDNV